MLYTSGLLPARTFAVAFKPAIIAPCAATFTTSARLSIPQYKTPQRTPLASTASKLPLAFSIRHASTAAASSASPQSAAGSQTLTWNRFLELRRTRRKWSVIASSTSAVGTAYFGLMAFFQGGYDGFVSAQLGIDPLFTGVLTMFGLLAVGWLIGPFFGGMAFNLKYSGIRADIANKEREFYNRIKRHRVDPTSSSMANPVPDYYGEKIGSVAGYRRWLKDQRAFNLKRGSYQGNK